MDIRTENMNESFGMNPVVYVVKVVCRYYPRRGCDDDDAMLLGKVGRFLIVKPGKLAAVTNENWRNASALVPIGAVPSLASWAATLVVIIVRRGPY
jgi:hypothetical protein